jgi:hypothetical protein
MIKKKNIYSINLLEKSIIILQVAGFLDGKKRNTGRNLSKMINKLILDYYNANKASFRLEVKKIELISILRDKQQIRDKIEQEISSLATDLTNIKEQINNCK